MKEKFITITGMNHYFGLAPFAVGRKVKCTKEPDNPFDSDAIKVTMKHIGKVGYVANSVNTVATGTKSASRIYDKVPKKFKAEIMFIMPWFVIAKVVEDDKSEPDAPEAKKED